MQFTTRLLAGLAFTTLAAGTATAEAAFPTKPVTIVSAYAPGGGGDVIARLIAPKLAKRLGQSVVVENKPGASGNIATDYVSRAPKDGYTVLINNSTLTVNAALGMPQSFHVQKDLKYIAAVASTPVAIGVHPSLPVKTLDELIAYARQHPGLSFSSCGNGTPQHFAGARIAQAAKLDMVHVAYKGCTPAIMDGIGNQVPVLFNTVANMDAHVKAGKLRLVAVASQSRLPYKADLPTVAETTGFKGFEAEVWFGFMGPSGLPEPVAKRLEQDLVAVMQDKELQKELADRFISVRLLDSAQFDKQVAQDLVNWKKLADELKVKLD